MLTVKAKARPEGFEPPTDGLEIRCSILLSYGRVRDLQISGRRCPREIARRLESGEVYHKRGQVT
jgi:hypothetical protein